MEKSKVEKKKIIYNLRNFINAKIKPSPWKKVKKTPTILWQKGHTHKITSLIKEKN